MSAPITLTGRLGGAPELRFSQNGKAVASFSVVTDRRQLDRNTNEWTSTGTTWWRCTAFGELAENLCETFPDKGAAVIVVGRVEEESWEDKQTGQKRTAMKVLVDDIGPSLKYATAKVAKANRNGNGGGQQQGGQNRGQQNQGSNYGGWDNSQPPSVAPAGGWGSNDSPPPF